MDATHFHLVINHLPVVGMLFSILLLIGGLIFKSTQNIKAAFIGIIISSIFTIPTFFSGEEAEETIEKILPKEEYFIHQHEEAAELAFIITLIVGVITLVVFFIQIKKERKVLNYLVLVASIISFIALMQAGATGGQIRHTEIRKNNTQNNKEINQNNQHKKQEKDDD